MFRTAGSNRPVTPRGAARAPAAATLYYPESPTPGPDNPVDGERRDFGLNLPATASRDAYRNAVANFPGMAARRPTPAVRPPLPAAPAPRAPFDLDLNDPIQTRRENAPSKITVRFSWDSPGDVNDMDVADACMTLEHYADWK